MPGAHGSCGDSRARSLWASVLRASGLARGGPTSAATGVLGLGQALPSLRPHWAHGASHVAPGYLGLLANSEAEISGSRHGMSVFGGEAGLPMPSPRESKPGCRLYTSVLHVVFVMKVLQNLGGSFCIFKGKLCHRSGWFWD